MATIGWRRWEVGGRPVAGVLVLDPSSCVFPRGWTCLAPRSTPRPTTVNVLTRRSRSRPYTTFAYGDDRMQKVDVWLPAGAGPFKTVLMGHGGCWQTAVADRSLMDWIAADLRDAGYAVWNIDYRGVDRDGGGYPGTFLDAARAADALRDHAGRFGQIGRASCRERVCPYV